MSGAGSSSFSKMEIRGIRSFDPAERQQNFLLFETPLTIIVGPNGTGKTTIVECLKYATTGEMPPGAGRAGGGAYFVHDPKIAGANVRGSVKLSFTDVHGKNSIVSRLLTSSIKGNKIECRTEDSAIASEIEPGCGQYAHITSKILDLNQEMMHRLGASKAVLTNVAFCHQEESNWPLSDPKTLKGKFDDIFDSAKYIKLLKTIKEERDAQKKDIDLFRGDLKHLKQYKIMAAEKLGELKNAKKELEESRAGVETIMKRLEPEQRKLDELNRKILELRAISLKIENKKFEESTIKERIRELGDSIRTPYFGTKEELEKELSHFASVMKKKEGEILELEESLAKVKEDREAAQKELERILKDFGRAEAEMNTHKEEVARRDQEISQAAIDFGISTSGYTSTPLSDVLVRRFSELSIAKIRDMEEGLNKQKKEYDGAIKEAEGKLNDLRALKAKFEHTKETKDREAEAKEKELSQLESEYKSSKGSQHRFQTLQQDKNRLDRDISGKSSELKEDEVKKELQRLKEEQDSRESGLKNLQSELRLANYECADRAKLADLERVKRTLEDQRDVLLSENTRRILERWLGVVPEEGLRAAVEELINNKSGEKEKAEKEVTKCEREKAVFEQEEKTLKAVIKELHGSLSAKELDLDKASGGDELDLKLAEFDELLEKARSEKGYMEGGRVVYGEFIKQVQQKTCCPLCERSFDTKKDAGVLSEKLTNKLEAFPKRLEELNRTITQWEENRNILLELKPVANDVKEIKTTRIPAKERELQTVQKQLQELKSRIDENRRALRMVTNEEASLKGIEDDAKEVERLRAEIARKESETVPIRARISGNATKNIEELEADIEQAENALSGLRSRHEAKIQKLHKAKDELARLVEEKNKADTELIEIRRRTQECSMYEQKKKDLQEAVSNCRRDADEAAVKLRPLEDECKRLAKELELIKKEKEDTVEKLQKKIGSAQAAFRDIDTKNKNIRRFVDGSKEREFEDRNSKKEALEKRIESLSARYGSEEKEMNRVKDEVNQNEGRRRELVDRRELWEKKEKLDAVLAEIGQLEKSQGEWAGKDVDLEQKEVAKRVGRLIAEKSRSEGKQEELEKKLEAIEQELEKPLYKEANRNHRDKMIELVTVEEAWKDLGKYYKALDHAIIKFHENKMKEINGILKNLWSQVYRGADITEIKISTEDENAVVGGPIDKRRSYNYRVMMKTTGNTWLDMRGRCSAGQKVLAALLIRVALSEVFCLSCGMLALDEPTTNLDRENVTQLAEALGKLVKQRSTQKNFQLLVITHDEYFVKWLVSECEPEHFYSVEKDDRGYSRLTRRTDFQAIHQ